MLVSSEQKSDFLIYIYICVIVIHIVKHVIIHNDIFLSRFFSPRRLLESIE